MIPYVAPIRFGGADVDGRKSPPLQPLYSFRTKKYPPDMTKLLDKALERVRRLPSENQDEIARAMMQLAGNDGEPEIIDAAHLSAVLESLGQRGRGEYAKEEEVEAAFRRFDR